MESMILVGVGSCAEDTWFGYPHMNKRTDKGLRISLLSKMLPSGAETPDHFFPAKNAGPGRETTSISALISFLSTLYL